MRFSATTLVLTLAASASLARAGFYGTIVGAENRIDFGAGTQRYREEAFVSPSASSAEFPTLALDEFAPSFAVDVADDTITISNFSRSANWDDFPFNGVIFDDPSVGGLAIAPFTGASLDPATTMAGLDLPHSSLPRLTFDADHVSLNWAGLDFATDTVVVLRVGFDGDPNGADASAVPTPSAAPAGVALLVAAMVRRRRAAR